MRVFRLVRRAYAWPLSGKGAALYGARWNSPGMEVVYTACNRSLAMAEVLVHLPLAALPDDYCMLELEVPETIPFDQLTPEQLPRNWNAFPHKGSTQRFGDDFLRKGDQLGLLVPSVVTRGDFNLLLNPVHTDFKKIERISLEPFPFDQRLLWRS